MCNVLRSKIPFSFCVSCTFPGPLVTLSDFHCVCVSGPLHSVHRSWDVIYFLKAMTNSFQLSKVPFLNLNFFQTVFFEVCPALLTAEWLQLTQIVVVDLGRKFRLKMQTVLPEDWQFEDPSLARSFYGIFSPYMDR